VPTQSRSAARREFRPVAEDQAAISVDLHDKDPAKSIERNTGTSVDDDLDRDERETRGSARESQEAFEERVSRSRVVQKRLTRQARELTRNFDQRLAEERAKHQRELAKYQRGGGGERVSRTTDAPDEAAHDREMTALQEQLVAAKEKGDSREEARLTLLITNKSNAFWHAKTMAQMGGGDGGQRDHREEETAAEQPKKGQPTRAGRKFIDANDWWDDPEFAAERAAANAIHQQLLDEGSDPEDEEHYAEIADKLTKKFRKLDVTIPGQRQARGRVEEEEEEEEEVETRRTSPTVGSRDRGNPSPNRRVSRNGRVRLSAADVANMKAYGMNPDNDKHVLAYAREAQLTDEAHGD
jgi:hypothetical protein